MIEIRNSEGQLAEMYPNTKISIEKNNPLFNDQDKLFEDITYPFKMPATDINKIFFNSGHLLESSNSVYEMDVTTVVSGYSFYAGKLTYSFINGDFEVLLKVNFGSIADKFKNEKINTIQTGDALPGFLSAAIMKDTCQNPAKYPYAFFPIKNKVYTYTPGGSFTSSQAQYDEYLNFYNAWDVLNQTFIYIPRNAFNLPIVTRQKAHYKLKYIIVKLIESLGYKASGSWIDDPETDHIYVFNHIYMLDHVLDSSTYFPAGYTFSEFFKVLKEDPRLQITLSFDVFKSEVVVESALSVLKSNKYLDIRDYVTQIEEFAPAKVNGYLVSLTPNSQDSLFNDPFDAKKQIPTNKLLIGDGEKAIEVQGTTFKSAVFGNGANCPDTMIDKVESFEGNALTEKKPIILLKYSGMKALDAGKIFPEASPFELDESHGQWYQFLNDTKELKITAYLPLEVLANLKIYEKILLQSKEGHHLQAILNKVEFNITNETEEYLNATITCNIIQPNKTIAKIVSGQNEIVSEFSSENRYVFKALFDPGLAPIRFEVFYPAGTIVEITPPYIFPNGPLATDVSLPGEINVSTDKGGFGGESATLLFPKTQYINSLEIRVFRQPKYILHKGEKYTFTAHASGYWFAKIFTQVNYAKFNNYKPIWIVF